MVNKNPATPDSMPQDRGTWLTIGSSKVVPARPTYATPVQRHVHPTRSIARAASRVPHRACRIARAAPALQGAAASCCTDSKSSLFTWTPPTTNRHTMAPPVVFGFSQHVSPVVFGKRPQRETRDAHGFTVRSRVGMTISRHCVEDHLSN